MNEPFQAAPSAIVTLSSHMSRFTTETKAQADVFTAMLDLVDIEWRYQSTFFDDEVCIHCYGNQERALIMSPIQFINWATYVFTPSKQEFQAKFQSQEEDEDDGLYP